MAADRAPDPTPATPGGPLELRVHGWARFLPVGFMVFWLCGWVMGEGFALRLLLPWLGAAAASEPVDAAPVAVSAFVGLWLMMWTVGGLAALTTVLRLVAGSDRVSWDEQGIHWVAGAWGIGPNRRIAADAIAGVLLLHDAVIVETPARRVVLSRLGRPEERRALHARLAAMLPRWRARTGTASGPALPHGWQVRDHGGAHATIERPVTASRRAAGVLAVIAVGSALLAWSAHQRADTATVWVALAAMVVTGLAAAQASVAVHALVVAPGALRVISRSLTGVREEVFEPLRLRLHTDTDSDGDRWFALEAHSGGRARRLAFAYHDPTAPEGLARWLAHRTGATVERAGQEPGARAA
jgi:hypothetical protein